LVKKKNPKRLFEKCPQCHNGIYIKELQENLWVCPKCDYYFRLSSAKRIQMLVDSDTFCEYDGDMKTSDPLDFKDRMPYTKRVESYRKKTSLNEAIISGIAEMGGVPICLCVLDFSFMGGSMGSVVGEKICRAADRAIKKKLPVIVVSSSGGARMQEGILSLMQMAKTAAAVSKLEQNRLPYISVMCDPTSGGVSASFAMLGDVNISEPRTLIAFAGPRVIKQTIKQDLPPGFQRAEFLLEHGMIDMVVERAELKSTLVRLLKLFSAGKTNSSSK